MNVIIAGGREFNNSNILNNVMDNLNWKIDSVVCGMASGADTLGKEWADSKGINVIELYAEWDRHGRKAGYIRNEKMAEVGNALVLFWDGKSRGSRNMLKLAFEYKLKPILIYLI